MVRVVDGDTVDFKHDDRNVTVRLAGIDAPEVGQCGAKEATTHLADLLAQADAISLGDPGIEKDDTDKHGRLIRYVSLRGWVAPARTPGSR